MKEISTRTAVTDPFSPDTVDTAKNPRQSATQADGDFGFYTHEQGHGVQIPIADLSRKHLKVYVLRKLLVVEGCKRKKMQSRGNIVEYRYEPIRKTIPLPENMEQSVISHHYDGKVLTISIRKSHSFQYQDQRMSDTIDTAGLRISHKAARQQEVLNPLQQLFRRFSKPLG
jgi:HSP20 family molecular chaperone IbpA